MTRSFQRWPALLVGLTMLTASPAWAEEAADVLKRADGLIQSGHGSDAEALLADAVVRWPRQAELHLRYGRLLEKQDLNALARAHFRAAVTLEPRNARALAAYGHALVTAFESDEALVYLRQAAELDPQNADAAYDLGRILIRSGPEAEAEGARWYAKAMALDPDNEDDQLDYAQYLLQGQKTDQAMAIFERVAAKPANVHAQVRLGRLLIENGTDKARGLNLVLGAFDTVIMETGDFADIGRMLYLASVIQMLDDAQRTAEIMPLMERFITLRPDDEDGYLLKGALYAKQKQWELAVASVERLRQRQPNNPSADAARAGIEVERGRWPAAREWFLKAVKRAPDMAAFHKNFGEAAEKHKATADAVAQYRHLVRLEPKEADSFVRLARALMQTGPKAKPEARKLVQQALNLEGDNAEALRLLKTLGGGK